MAMRPPPKNKVPKRKGGGPHVMKPRPGSSGHNPPPKLAKLPPMKRY